MDCFQLLYMLVGVKFITSVLANKNKVCVSLMKLEFKYYIFYFIHYLDLHINILSHLVDFFFPEKNLT